MVCKEYKKGINVEFESGNLEDYKESIYSILESNRLLTLSTIDMESSLPNVCSAFYVYDDDFNLYLWTDGDSIHSKNIKNNNLVAVNIADSNQKWGSELQGLQIKGKAFPLSILKMLKPAKLYMDRYPLVKKLIKSPQEFNTKFDSKLYKIEINWIKVFDEVRFGKEVWKKLEVKKN